MNTNINRHASQLMELSLSLSLSLTHTHTYTHACTHAYTHTHAHSYGFVPPVHPQLSAEARLKAAEDIRANGNALFKVCLTKEEIEKKIAGTPKGS